MGGGERCDRIAFKRMERKKLKMTTERTNRLIKYINTKDVTETNNLIVASIVWITKELGLKRHIKRVKQQEPMVEKKD